MACFDFGLSGLRFRVFGLGSRVEGLGLRVWGLGCGICLDLNNVSLDHIPQKVVRQATVLHTWRVHRGSEVSGLICI